MSSFIIKGNILYSRSKDELVLDDGVLRHPQELTPRERLERAVYLCLDDRGGVCAKFVAGKKIL